MNCKECKFWNKKKVIQPANSGMCENRKSEHHKAVVSGVNECKKFRKGGFDKSSIIYLTK